MHALITAGSFLLVLICTVPVHSLSFFSTSSPYFSIVSVLADSFPRLARGIKQVTLLVVSHERLTQVPVQVSKHGA